MIDNNSSDYEKWNYFEYCRSHKTPIQGKLVSYDERFGFTIDIFGMSAHMSKSELTYARHFNPEVFIDKTLSFHIISVSRYTKTLKVSYKRKADNLKSYDLVEGVITKILPSRIFVDCGISITIHKRDLADRFIDDIEKHFHVGQVVKCMLTEDVKFSEATTAVMKHSAIWNKKTDGINENDVLEVEFVEQKEAGIIVKYNGLSLFIGYNFLTQEYKELFDNNSITEGTQIIAAVSRLDRTSCKINLSMPLAEKIEKKKAREEERARRNQAIADLKSQLELGLVIEAIVKKVDRRKAIINISGTDLDFSMNREDLSPNKVINAGDEVFVGERVHVVYVGENDGELVFKRNLIMKDIYDPNLYDLSLDELLDVMGIHSSEFVGKVTKLGSDHFFTNVITKSDNPLENGKLLVDPQIGRSIFVLIPPGIAVEQNAYYEFELKLATKSLRQKEGSPFMFSADKFRKCGNPYKELVNIAFSQQTSPSSNTTIANLLEEVGQNLYTSKKRMFFELLQNADDAAPKDGVKVKIQIIGGYFVITHDGFAFNQHDFESITSAAKSTKRSSSKKTGYKGIGFKSVFTNSQSVFIKSLGFTFAFDKSLETYNDFRKFYFLVNDIENDSVKQDEFIHKYSKYYREFNGVKDIPWQLLPIWRDDFAIEPANAIFNSDENVAIALKMDEATLNEYGEAVREVFSQPRFMLFLRNTNRVQLLINGQPLTIQKNKDERNEIITLVNSFSKDKISEDYRIVTVDSIEVNDDTFAEAGVLMKREERTNNRGEKENYFVRVNEGGGYINEVTGIPDRIASTTDTTISFAIQLDDNGKIIKSETGESSLYAYLPMNEHRFKFPFYINADFIPKSDREGVQSDNPWNHFLFYTIGQNIVKMVAKLASSSEPNYLQLLLSSAFESNSQDTAALINSFNRGYLSELKSAKFVINDAGNPVGTNDILIDGSDLSKNISASSFYDLLGTSKRLPHSDIDCSILQKKIFEIENVTVKDVVNKLVSNIDVLNSWIQNASDDDRNGFYEWVSTHIDEAKSLLPLIKILTFKGNWKSQTEIKANMSFVVLTDKMTQLKDVLSKLNFICSDITIETHPLSEQIKANLPTELKLYEEIITKDFQALNFSERLSLFECVSKFYGVGEEKLKNWAIFKNQNGEFMPLFSMCAFTPVHPAWLNKYFLNEQENSETLGKFLIPQKDIFSSIVELHIHEILEITSIFEVYSTFKNSWRSQFTSKLFNRLDNKDLLPIVEQSDDATKESFISRISSLPISSTSDYKIDSFEYRVIKLSVSNEQSIEHLRRIITIDTKPLKEYTVKDELNLSFDGRTISFLISKLVPSFSSSSVLSRTSSKFRSIPDYEKIFELREASPAEVRNELYNSLNKNILATAYQYLFLITYRRSQGYVSFDNALKSILNVNDQQVFTKILDLAMEQRLGDVLKAFISNGGVSYPFTKLIGTYFNCNEYILTEERTPSFIESWADNEDKMKFLIELGLHGEKSKEIERRKSFKDKRNENIWNITDSNTIQSFLQWVISDFQLPINDANQVEILKSLCQQLKPYRVQESYDEVDVINASEWNNPRYLEWKQSPSLKIFVVDGLIPYRCIYAGQYLYQEQRDTIHYFSSSNKLYISSSKEPASILSEAYADRNIPFNLNDWNQIFLISADEADRQLAEKDQRIRELEATLAELEGGSSSKIGRGSNNSLSKKEQYKAQLEAQRFLMGEMSHWSFPEDYGTSNDAGIPYCFSTEVANDDQGNAIPFVLKSHKAMGEPFKINPEEWDYMMKQNAHLFIYDGDRIVELEPRELIMNQPSISITFSTENLDIEERINAFADSLHYFKDLHFDFESFNISKKAKDIRAIYNIVDGQQESSTDDDL